MINQPITTTVEFTPAWTALLSRPRTDWRVAEAALCAANQYDPPLVIADYLLRLDAMVADVATRIVPHATVASRIAALNQYFYIEQGYAGNNSDYFDIQNSFLNAVMDRKLGIPITLAILYLELARAMQMDAYGIGFPGHFLVGIRAADRHWYIDVFNQGRVLQSPELKTLLLATHKDTPPSVIDLSAYLKPATELQIVVRLLRNLKKIYIEKTAVAESLQVIAMILSLLPDSPDELRDRGMIYQHIDYTRGALADLSRFLELVSQAQERPLIESIVESLRQRPTHLH
ncbi:MAG: tetratricopeptide repeat protein [Gammaproteobacteria bacterium]|nr:tetratricopeptide repeat protein [Gammaproteobacteria bacterium]